MYSKYYGIMLISCMDEDAVRYEIIILLSL